MMGNSKPFDREAEELRIARLCKREANRRWRKNNPEKCKEIQDRYYARHQPEILAKRKLRYREEKKRKEAERAKSGQ